MSRIAFFVRASTYIVCFAGILTLVGIVSVCAIGLFENQRPVSIDSQGVSTMAEASGFGSIRQVVAQNEFRSGPDGLDLGGVSNVSPNSVIHWRSAAIPNSQGATPLDVLFATRDRLQHLQGGPHASNEQAKALWSTIEAIEALEGRRNLTETHLGASE